MKKFTIQPSKIKGSISIPPSKSHTLRAIFFGMMAEGTSTIRNFLHSSDALSMIEAVRQLGAQIEMFPNFIKILGTGGKLKPAENVIDCGNSGLVLRLIGAISALLPSYTILTGDHSIRYNRPIKPLLSALKALGAFAVSSCLNDHAPMIIKGPIKPGKVIMEGEDSQPVSGMLLLTSFAKGQSIIEVKNPGETPWIDLTLDWLKRLGISIENHHYNQYVVPGNSKIKGFDVSIPGDFSSAAFPLAAALITGSEIEIFNLDMKDIQGDKELIFVLKQMGAQIFIDDAAKALIVKKSPQLKGMEIDVNRFIDAVPILSVIACFADGKTTIMNAAIARKKESDRIHAIATELKKMGAYIEEKEDGLVIHPSSLKGTMLTTYDDQRIAMALSVAALSAKGTSTIIGTECTLKTYPEFFKHFLTLGAVIEES